MNQTIFKDLFLARPERQIMLAKEIKKCVCIVGKGEVGKCCLVLDIWYGSSTYLTPNDHEGLNKVPRRKTANPKMPQCGSSFDPEKAPKNTHCTHIWFRWGNESFFRIIHFTFPLRTTFFAAQRQGCEFVVVRTGTGKIRSRAARVLDEWGLMVIHAD